MEFRVTNSRNLTSEALSSMEEISRQNKIHLPASLQSGPLNNVISVGDDVSAWQLSIVFRWKETKLSLTTTEAVRGTDH